MSTDLIKHIDHMCNECKNKEPILIAPSLLSADFSCLGEEIKKVERGGADWLHLDVMDGHFVPNLSIGPCVVEAVRRVTSLPLDVHLMIENPSRYVDPFIKAGADILSFHIEVLSEPIPLIREIKGKGIKAGLVINPDTEAERVIPFIKEVDLVLVMSVYPGFGGQKFISRVLPKAKKIKEKAVELSSPPLISMDGGINLDNVHEVAACGVNVIVAGSSIFQATNPEDEVRLLRKRAEEFCRR